MQRDNLLWPIHIRRITTILTAHAAHFTAAEAASAEDPIVPDS